ncbi:diguanylate phosphodiesterase [Pantoea sp. BS_4]|uniref:diguanylate phosphodiesterase n=1 Tax=Pantoea TaxID=53335 RepID=UPI0006306C82|nr:MULTISPECIES: diguanylate phosphodiesterase [Pantoea]KKW51088.1 diguanylate phosphodiesterase [Pantoea ananatis]KTS26347.1 diguanylate phosphodiesterase [Pantoea stewartii]MBC0855645.1 diguanylate phosphodiesterase [Pantoea stewartii]MDF7787762.1 diguanylate phosphodiesterase [Pantoea stewartii]MDK2633823.1 diguanylate phosphodiesterase [Pantoea stewartii subsp. indologenes]
MLTTIIYRSHISDDVPVKTLPGMVDDASILNASHDVTGILLFNGTHFFQLLEGPEEGVLAIYQRICADRRHHNLVELMRDYAPSRRFGNAGMELFDLREHDRSTVLQAVLDKGTSKYQLTYADRALQFLRTFVEAREKENYFEVLPSEYWEFIPESTTASKVTPSVSGITFRPVVDPLARQVTAIEAIADARLRRTEQRDSSKQLHDADLDAVITAFRMAGRACPDEMTLYVSLLPMTLVVVPDAVQTIVAAINAAGLVPEQVVIGVSETEVISRVEAFSVAVRELKAAGISLSVDNFGAGSAGLSLLTHIQPDRIRIDSSITSDVHRSGPKQAVVQAIIKCCSALEITVIAAGIVKAEEWMWLEAAGVINFQGSLFAPSGALHSDAVAWPEYRSAM